MKKFFILIVCLAIVSVGFAQKKSIDLSKITLGAKAGVNICKFTGRDMRDIDASAKAGVHIGVASEFKVAQRFVVAPELLFSTQGVSIIGISSQKGSFFFRASYINIPIMARFYVLDALSVELGPQFGLATGVTEIYKRNDYKETLKLDAKEDYNVFDFGVGFGVSYNYNHRFFLSARYNLGFTDVLRTDKPYDNKNGVFQFSVGYNFYKALN